MAGREPTSGEILPLHTCEQGVIRAPGRPDRLHLVDVITRVYGVRLHDRVYHGMTISFDVSIEEIWPTFAAVATLVVGPTDSRRIGAELGEFLADTGVTVFCCVPTLLATIGRELPVLRTLLVGGEACPAGLVERWPRLRDRQQREPGRTTTAVLIGAPVRRTTPGPPVVTRGGCAPRTPPRCAAPSPRTRAPARSASLR